MQRKMILAAMLATTTVLSAPAMAQTAYIRLEAAPDAQAQAALSRWQTQLPDAAILDLPGRWTGIVLGPLDITQAVKRYDEMRAAGTIPRDSFLTGEDGRKPLGAQALRDARSAITTDDAAQPSPTQTETTDTQTAHTQTGTSTPEQATPAQPATPETPTDPADDTAPGTDTTDTGPNPEDSPQTQEPPTEAKAEAAPTPPQPTAPQQPEATPQGPDSFIRLRALQTRDKAEAELAALRESLPSVSLFELPSGWFALAMGPLAEDSAAAWAKTFKASGLIAGDSFITPRADLGQILDEGPAPNLPEPDKPADMPPLDQVQQALRWGGYYDGAIDGRSGPQTRKAIATAMGAERLSTDSGTAMQRLLKKRDDWRAQMGLKPLDDAHTGLSAIAPLDKIAHKENKGPMAIYGPRDGSGAALILIADQGGRDRMNELAGLITALGWVPQADRQDGNGQITLRGADDTHSARAELRRSDDQITGFVLIWPTAQKHDVSRIAAEISDSLRLTPKPQPDTPATPTTGATGN